MIIAIDPGLTTGIAVGSNIVNRSYDLVLARDLAWKDRAWLLPYLTDNCDQITAIVIEQFRLFPNQRTLESQIGSDMPASRMIERVVVYAELLGLDKLIYWQQPSDIHSRDPRTHRQTYALAFPKEHLPHLQSDHQKDAYSHLRYHILMHYRSARHA